MNNMIRAKYNDDTITVYQAFNPSIAQSACLEQTFISPPFKKDRMTWIKPSFLWMMYRSGWASKENQEKILGISIKRAGFEWALRNACLSHFNKDVYQSYEHWKNKMDISPVRIQWDPEKDIFLKALDYKSIQIGLSGFALETYVSEWIVNIEDITDYCKEVSNLIKNNLIDQAKDKLPIENIYPLPIDISNKIGAT